MTRSAVSIASNIAEGAERDSRVEFIRFLHIAKGSTAELRTQVYIAGQIGLFSKNLESELAVELKAISSMIHGLIKSLKNSVRFYVLRFKLRKICGKSIFVFT
jgi:four helix bundle protein